MPHKSRKGGPKKGSRHTSKGCTPKESEPELVHDSPDVSEAEQSDHDDAVSVVEHGDQTQDKPQ